MTLEYVPCFPLHVFRALQQNRTQQNRTERSTVEASLFYNCQPLTLCFLHIKSHCLYIWRIRRQVGNFVFSFIASKRPFRWTIFRNTPLKLKRVHILAKSRKVRNTAQSTKMTDGIYAKLHIFNRPVQKQKNLPGFHIHTVCNLHFDHFSEFNVILK